MQVAVVLKAAATLEDVAELFQIVAAINDAGAEQ